MKEIIIYLNKFFDILWIPLSIFPPYIDIIIISAISAIVILFVFKKTSNQKKIKLHKGRITAHILQIRLYKDRPLLTLQNIFNILIENILYLRFNLIPLTIIIIPIIIISVQINNRYGYQPVKPGDSFIIQAVIDKKYVTDPEKFLIDMKIHTPPEIQIETSPVIVFEVGTIFWRVMLAHTKNLKHTLNVSIDGDNQSAEKYIFTSYFANGFSPEKSKFKLKNVFVDNVEGFLPEGSPFKSITVNYERAPYPFFYWNIDSIILYFLLTLIIALIFKPLIKVTI